MKPRVSRDSRDLMVALDTVIKEGLTKQDNHLRGWLIAINYQYSVILKILLKNPFEPNLLEQIVIKQRKIQEKKEKKEKQEKQQQPSDNAQMQLTEVHVHNEEMDLIAKKKILVMMAMIMLIMMIMMIQVLLFVKQQH